MHFITGSTFNMGAANDDPLAHPDERPVHSVTVSSFYMDQYEVTVQRYAAFLNDIGGYRQVCSGFDCVVTGFETQFTYLLNNVGFYEPKAGYDAFPVNWVSWYGAHDYCAWAGGRLPTEAEWEYAARGIDGRFYPWGNQTPQPDLAIFGIRPSGETFVTAFQPANALLEGVSPFGLYGMAGGVREWVQDWYQPDSYQQNRGAAANTNETGGQKVLRGGGWSTPADGLRTTARFHLPPTLPRIVTLGELEFSEAGFRCAMDVP
jgi:formylglycine-generating enzyme required for sulfatase activity